MLNVSVNSRLVTVSSLHSLNVSLHLPSDRLLASLSDGRSFTLSGKKGLAVMYETTCWTVCVCVCVCWGCREVNKGDPHRAPGPGVPGGPVTEVMDDVFSAG